MSPPECALQTPPQSPVATEECDESHLTFEKDIPHVANDATWTMGPRDSFPREVYPTSPFAPPDRLEPLAEAPMKRVRLILSALLLSSVLGACSSSLTAPDDCAPEVLVCGWPGSGG